MNHNKSKVLANWRFGDFLEKLDIGQSRVVLEIRGPEQRLPSQLIKTMQEHNVIHCVECPKGKNSRANQTCSTLGYSGRTVTMSINHLT